MEKYIPRQSSFLESCIKVNEKYADYTARQYRLWQMPDTLDEVQLGQEINKLKVMKDLRTLTSSNSVKQDALLKNLADLNVSGFQHIKVKVKQFSEQEQREIVFEHVVEEKIHHTTILVSSIESNYQRVVGFFDQSVMRELRLFVCYDILFGKV